MSKMIRVNDVMLNECLEEVKKNAATYRGLDGKVTFTKVFSDDRKTNLWYTPDAWEKQMALVTCFSTEVAWHGVCKRVDGGYLIEDIVVYPQTVTDVTVDMEVDKYAKWLFENADDERFDHLFMQGHSHVNMGTSPSGPDLGHQEDILKGLAEDGFYVFVIFNKKYEHFARIYDMKDNALYDTGDITVAVYGSSPTAEFVKEARKLVFSKPASYVSYNRTQTYPGSGNVYSPYYSGAYAQQSSAKSSKPKGRIQSASGYVDNFTSEVHDPYDYEDDMDEFMRRRGLI